MSLQEWAAKVLVKGEGFQKGAESASLVGAHGIRVTREGRPDALVYCPDPEPAPPFGRVEFDNALSELPDLQFVVVVRRKVDPALYAYADNLGIPIGSIADVRSALFSIEDISRYVAREHSYIRSRFGANRHVMSYHRLGRTTFKIERTGRLRSLNVAMVDDYEVTAEQVYSVINDHPEIGLDAVVTTNPSCRGISKPASDAARAAGVELLTLADFLISLREPWTT